MMSLVFLFAGLGDAMVSTDDRAVVLEVAEKGDAVEVVLTGHSSVEQTIAYELALTGNSTSRHRGKTTLAADRSVVLSRMTMPAKPDWCVTATITEQDGRSYSYEQGSCD